MKALFSTLLLSGLLFALAPSGAAQRVVASEYRGHAGRYEHAARGHASSRIWIPGRYETVHERVWIPGCTERVWVEPVFRLAYDSCGNRVRLLVSAGHWENVGRPGHYETRAVRVWRPGYWVARGRCDD